MKSNRLVFICDKFTIFSLNLYFSYAKMVHIGFFYSSYQKSGVKLRTVIVIGGGASGMTAAVFAAREGADVVLLEHMDRVGKRFSPQATENATIPTGYRIRAVTEEKILPLHGRF